MPMYMNVVFMVIAVALSIISGVCLWFAWEIYREVKEPDPEEMEAFLTDVFDIEDVDTVAEQVTAKRKRLEELLSKVQVGKPVVMDGRVDVRPAIELPENIEITFGRFQMFRAEWYEDSYHGGVWFKVEKDNTLKHVTNPEDFAGKEVIYYLALPEFTVKQPQQEKTDGR